METEPQKPREELPAPSRNVRLAWWFGIYLAGQVPLIILGLIHQAPGLILVPFFFPWELGGIFALVQFVLPESVTIAVSPLFFILPYAFYLGHLVATLRAHTRRRFDFLLLVLVIVVLFNQWIIAEGEAHFSN
jgi:hypothetical protein